MKQKSQNVEKKLAKCSFYAFSTSNTRFANLIVVVKVNVLPKMPEIISY